MNILSTDPAARRLSLLFTLFIAFAIGMNVLGGKVTSFFGIAVSVSILMMPLTFLITDIVSEVYGAEYTRRFVRSGIIAIVVIMLYTALFVTLPPHERYTFNEEYTTIFSGSLRIMLASVIAFAVSQFHDVWAFEFWKRKMGGKYLWLRNNLSTAASQAIDTLIFMYIAFYGINDQFTALFVLQMAIPFYLFKLGVAALDTPFVYLGVRWLRHGMQWRRRS